LFSSSRNGVVVVQFKDGTFVDIAHAFAGPELDAETMPLFWTWITGLVGCSSASLCPSSASLPPPMPPLYKCVNTSYLCNNSVFMIQVFIKALDNKQVWRQIVSMTYCYGCIVEIAGVKRMGVY